MAERLNLMSLLMRRRNPSDDCVRVYGLHRSYSSGCKLTNRVCGLHFQKRGQVRVDLAAALVEPADQRCQEPAEGRRLSTAGAFIPLPALMALKALGRVADI